MTIRVEESLSATGSADSTVNKNSKAELSLPGEGDRFASVEMPQPPDRVVSGEPSLPEPRDRMTGAELLPEQPDRVVSEELSVEPAEGIAR